MRFKDTRRFSPVIYGGDLPHERDLYWHDPYSIPRQKKLYNEYIKDNGIIIDRHWWGRQRKRCLRGYYVDDIIDFNNGDIFIEGLNYHYIDDKTISIPHLGIEIHDGRVWISGKHYFYLNFWVIQREDRELGRKVVGNPYFTDLSFENWWIRERMRKEKKDMLWAKSRQRGLSEEEACDTAYDISLLYDIQLAIVGGRSDYNERTFAMVKRGLDNLYNTQFYKERSVNTGDFLVTRYTNAQLHSRTAKGNPQVLSGLTPYHTKLEEIGIMEPGLVKDVINFIKPSLYVRGQKVGYITNIGTGGEADIGVEDMEKMFYNPSEFNLLEFDNIYEEGTTSKISCFIPAWKFEIVDDDGNSLKEESLKALDEEEKKMDSKGRFQHRVLKPRKPSDIFGVITGGFFGEQIAQWCNEARAHINNVSKARIVERGDLVWIDKRDMTKGVRWVHNPDSGLFLVAEHPKLSDNGLAYPNIYYGGTDSYDQDEALTSSSKLSSTIFKTYDYTSPYTDQGITNNFIALYLDRPSVNQGGAVTAFENSAKLHIYYNAMNLIEYSKLLIFDWYENNGLGMYLTPRPDLAIANMVEKTSVSNKYGFHGSLVPQGLKMLRDWLDIEENVKKCPFPEILLAWSKFKIAKNYNCDITISTMLCIVSVDNEKKYLEQDRDNKETVISKFKGYRKVNGVMKAIYK